MAISAVIPTKGTRAAELGMIVSHLIQIPDIDEIIIVKGDKGPFRRYTVKTKNDIIYTQDDDCLTDVSKIIKTYKENVVTCGLDSSAWDIYSNTREKLVGWGTIFHESKKKVLDKYIERFGADDIFKREADRIFTYMNDCVNERVEIRNFPSASTGNAMSLQQEHPKTKDEAIKRCQQLI